MKFFLSFVPFGFLCLWLALTVSAEPAPVVTETNAQESLRAYLQLQEQLHANQLAIDAARKEAEEAAAVNKAALARNAESLAARLKSIEDALTTQRGEELKSIQSSSRMMLTLAGGFSILGIGAMLLMAFLQWRTVNRLAEISGSLPAWRPLGSAPEVKVLGSGEEGPSQAVQDVNAQLAASLDRLEKRMLGLEERSRPPLQAPLFESPPSNGERHNGNGMAAAAQPGSAGDLLARGQAMLEQDRSGEALALFEQAINLDPANADAFVRKGSALEKLGRLDEAIKCFDSALEIDGSLTIAYLHKGGLLNRMEKFAEALECYEKALRTQEKQIA